jgi:adenylosuccinate synthase
MAAKNKATQAGAGAFAAGKAVRSNPYVQRVMQDPELRENLRSAFESARKAYTRMSNGKSPVKAVTEDKKVQRELKEAANSLKDAADSLRGQKKKKRGKGRLLLVAVVGAGLALALSEGLRKKVLDTLFGAEEEFEYTASTTPEPPASTGSTESESEPVGTS